MGTTVLHLCTDALLMRIALIAMTITTTVTIVERSGGVYATDMRQVVVWRPAEQLLVQVQIEHLEARIHRLDEDFYELGTIDHIPYLEAAVWCCDKR
jgi:hypothetical protein